MYPRAIRIAVVTILVCGGPSASLRARDAPGKLRVLLLSGQNNHNWQETTPRIKQILEDSGRFVVDVSDHPERTTAETLNPYAVVVSNWNSFHRENPPAVVDWPEATRQAFLGFVQGGRGFVTVHAGGSSFYETWPEYHELVIARYGFNMTGHGVQHVFPVHIEDAEHPVTRGMRDFVFHDELWHNPWVVSGATVLASAFSASESGGSGKQEPVVFVRPLGAGRCFAALLGHDQRIMQQPAFGTLLCRGTEWAATGGVTLPLPKHWPTTAGTIAALGATPDEALAAIRSYRFGQDRAPLQVVEALVTAAADAPQESEALADRLASLLAADVTAECKRFVCQQLARIGSAGHVPALAPLLKDPQLAVAARGALETIPAPEAAAALRDALRSADGELRIGLIHSLTRRRDTEVVPLIATLVQAEDAGTREAAMAALGAIGGPAAHQALLHAKTTLPGDSNRVWAEAVLECAERLLDAGERQAAAPLYEALTDGEQPEYIRVKALAGHWACQPQPDRERLWSALLGADLAMQAAALDALALSGDSGELDRLASNLVRLPERLQPQVIALLAARGVSLALPAISAALEQSDPDTRREALSAMAVLGDESTVAMLAGQLDVASPAEKRLIADGLARLKGDGVNRRLISLARSIKPEHACEVVKALVARSAKESVTALLELARRDDASLADEAVRALGELAEAGIAHELIVLLASEQRAASAGAITAALVQVSRRSPDEPAGPTLAALATADDRLAGELLSVLSGLGGPAALQAVRDRTASASADLRLPAVRALAAWPDATALEPLLEVARAASQAQERILALRGFARLLREAADLPITRRTALLEQAVPLAEGVDEKHALLSCVAAAPSGSLLRWVAGCLSEAEVSDAACLAIFAMSPALEEEYGAQLQAAIFRILTISTNSEVRSRAFRRLCRLGGLANLARSAQADSPDGWEPDFGGKEADAAIDGNAETYWDEQDNQSLYRLRLSFERPTAVAAIAITGYRHHYHAPRGFSVVCDDREVAAVKDAKYADNYLAVTFPATTCTTLELVITDYFEQSPAVRELEVYGPLVGDDSPQLEWQRTDSTLALLNHGRPVWQFNYGPAAPKPFFHPVALVDGTVLTWEAPPDHPWHHGHWFSWKYINGLNYWEESRETGKSQGHTTVSDVRIQTGSDHAARIALRLRYGRPAGEPVLTEERVIEVSAPDESGVYHFDWTLTFTAGGQDVVLDRTPLPDEPEGKVWGGYAGLAFRFAENFRDAQAVSSSGEALTWSEDRHRSKAAAMEYHGLLDGRAAGLAILDHPDNLNAPSPWYLIRSKEMTFANPALLCYGAHTLPAGQTLTLRYRVIVHPGHWNVEELQRQLARFVPTKKAEPRAGK